VDYDSKKSFDSQGFGTLAKYIGVFGKANNAGEQPIAMTAPVMTQEAAGTATKIAMTAPVITQADATAKHQTMAFVLPVTFTLESAPKPLDARVKLKPVEPSIAAVHSFTWGCSMVTAEKKKEEMVQWLERDGYQVAGPWSLCRYNPPFTIPFLKTNEIHIPIQPKV
jgi:hypothetical protein